MKMDAYYQELVDELNKRQHSKQELSSLKVRLCKKYAKKTIPTDIEVLLHTDAKTLRFPKVLQTKPMRSQSGVTPIAIMTKPIACKHGVCAYCPGGPRSAFGSVPQSYTGNEPSTMRAIRNHYDPYLITFNRLEQFTVLGHAIDKNEVIIQGGTFPSFPKSYRDYVIASILGAMNDFGDYFYKNGVLDVTKFREFFELPGNINDKERSERIHKKLEKMKKKKSLVQEQKRNETSVARMVALCIETKPDYAKRRHINDMLRLGTTRVEMGVQTVYNEVLQKINRGHTIEDTVKATRLLKDSFLKVCYHMMPGLPDVSYERDLDSLGETLRNPDFRPDAYKIYPTMVMKGTKLYADWKKGLYQPMDTAVAAKLIAQFKKSIPPYIRIMRVQRDIPTNVTEAGVDRTNLRQYVEEYMKNHQIVCRCIRCREPKGQIVDSSAIVLHRLDYDASGGKEVFLEAVAPGDVLVGFCRLRIPSQSFRSEITPKSAGIRELHVYGVATPLGETGSVQHKGIGSMLLKEAERVVKYDYGREKLLVISGIGVREYYKKRGYVPDGPYVSKWL